MTDSEIIDDDNMMVPERFKVGHPHADWKKLRDTAPIYYCRPNGYRPYWAITKYNDVVEIEKRSDVFLNEPQLSITPIAFEEYMNKNFGSRTGLSRIMANMDAPEHMPYRTLLAPWLSPKFLLQREAEIRATCGIYFDRVLKDEEGEIDLAQDLAYWFPLRVACGLLGLPEEEDRVVLNLSQQVFRAAVPRPGSDEKSGQELMADYFKAIADDRRRNPKEDLSTYLVQAKIDGKPLQDRDLVGYFQIMATAGHDTTSSAISGGVKALIEHPAQMEALRNDRSLMRGAVEEILRWVTPTIHFARTAARDYELRGQTIRKGETVVLYFSSANRDEEVFSDPDRFDITRSPNRHLAFGTGPHGCLGAQLARLETASFLNILLDRVEHLQIIGPTPSIAASLVTRLAHLPVRYRLRKSAVKSKTSAS